MAKKSNHRDSQVEANIDEASADIESSVENATDRFAAMTAPFVQSLDRSSATLLKSWMALEEEAVRIANNRLERDAEVMRQCQDCKTMSDRFAAQQQWLIDIGQDYIQDSLRLGKVMQDIFTGNFAEFADNASHAARRTAHEVQSAVHAAAGE